MIIVLYKNEIIRVNNGKQGPDCCGVAISMTEKVPFLNNITRVLKKRYIHLLLPQRRFKWRIKRCVISSQKKLDRSTNYTGSITILGPSRPNLNRPCDNWSIPKMSFYTQFSMLNNKKEVSKLLRYDLKRKSLISED